MKWIMCLTLLTCAPMTYAKYFFMANDVMVTKCFYTDIETERELRQRIEEATPMKCQSVKDKIAIVMSCKGATTNMFVYTDSERSCESIARDFTILLST